MSETANKHKASAPKTLNFGIFICSTSRYQQTKRGEKVEDPSGDLIMDLLKVGGHNVLFKEIILDDVKQIQQAAKRALQDAHLDVCIFCGGTGITPTDVTIETMAPMLEKTLPGFGEIFRRLSYDQVGSAAVMTRALAGIAKGKAFFCIPGSPNAVRLSVETLILAEAPHIVKHVRE
jgi:molybdenum cofactor biosynthesis protein B